VIEADQLWSRCAATVREQVSEAVWHAAFEGIRPIALDGSTLVLAVPNPMMKERIEGRFGALVRDALTDVTGSDHDLQVLVDSDLTDGPAETGGGGSFTERSYQPLRPISARTPSATTQGSGSGRDEHSGPLNPRYMFESFVIGTSNRFAHAAAQRVAETPGRSYNPLFIYGGVGLGKTHLLHAIGHYVRKHYPDRNVRYVSTETFTNEFIEAIRTSSQTAFKRRFRDCDVLLVDDIQFIATAERTQEEFFHTFNSLYESNRQIVITSDRQPNEIPTLEDRLRTRFAMGLVTDVQPPDLETRVAILRRKAETERAPVPDEVATAIASRITENIRELEGALNRIIAHASLDQEPISVALAERVLATILSGSEARQITPQVILDATAKMFGFTVEELASKSRRRPLVQARQISMYAFRQLTDYSYPAIAREFGGRDHTTVIHAVDKITTLMKEKRNIFDQVTELEQRIRSGG
jgi:chromosomal replication initiator protein